MFTARPRRNPSRRPGSTLPAVVILLVVLVGMVAFAIDVGYIAHARTELQRSADLGALAGAGRLAVLPGRLPDTTSARSEVRRFVALNQPGLTVLDQDVTFGYFDPAAGTRFSTTPPAGAVANAVKVTVRRDARANGPLNLFFAPVIGRRQGDARATAVVYLSPGGGVKSGPDLLPYTIQVDYFRAAAGLPPRPGAINVDRSAIRDQYTAVPGLAPTPGADGTNEVVLFGSSKNAPGNFGSLDIGSGSNGTTDLVRQILDGPTAADFTHPDFAGKVGSDGALHAPLTLGGDTGLSSAVQDAFTAIIGQRRIVPLYDRVTGTGNNAVYRIVGFAGVVIVAADLTANPKYVLAQPTGFMTSQVLPPGPNEPSDIGLFVGRLVMP